MTSPSSSSEDSEDSELPLEKQMGVSSTQYVCVDSWLLFDAPRVLGGGGGRSLLAEVDGGGGIEEGAVSSGLKSFLRVASVPYFKL